MVNYSIVSQKYRYTLCDDSGEELYDIIADPNEWHNLIGDEKHSEIAEKMNKKLKEMKER
jgi:hypothetical protein